MDIYGILAHPVGHSLSPFMHNAAFKKTGIDAYYYAFDVPQNELEDFVNGLIDGGVCGLSISLPYKETIMSFLDEIDEDASLIKAVNTLKIIDGKLLGFNTDWIGAVRALEEVTTLEGKVCAVLGAGGAARAIVYGLKKRGAEIHILNRTIEKAQLLAEEFGCSFGTIDQLEQVNPDVVIQSTSIWLENPEAKLINAACLKPNMIVMDIVYKPLITPLLKQAQEAGCAIITGEKMLYHQALEQFKIWTNQEAPKEIMMQSLNSKLSLL